MTQELFATRFSDSVVFLRGNKPKKQASGFLVRIYPMQNIGQLVSLDGAEYFIGRDTACQLMIEDDSVSRKHARIELIGEDFVVFDLNSTNGTYVNDKRVCECAITSGDRIRFGNQIFNFLGDQSVEAQYHEAVYKMMTTDGLTQVHNRRFLTESAERELIRSHRTGCPTSLLMIDLDRFKSINDTYGHLAGDAVLVEFAKRAKSVLRDGELFARYGGEEFSVLVGDACIEDALAVANRILIEVSSKPVLFEEQPIELTVSIGVAEYDPYRNLSFDALVEEADKALYKAKQSGRNCVIASFE